MRVEFYFFQINGIFPHFLVLTTNKIKCNISIYVEILNIFPFIWKLQNYNCTFEKVLENQEIFIFKIQK
jgi:hypothetical protein